jgi:hypothetical protein
MNIRTLKNVIRLTEGRLTNIRNKMAVEKNDLRYQHLKARACYERELLDNATRDLNRAVKEAT